MNEWLIYCPLESSLGECHAKGVKQANKQNAILLSARDADLSLNQIHALEGGHTGRNVRILAITVGRASPMGRRTREAW